MAKTAAPIPYDYVDILDEDEMHLELPPGFDLDRRVCVMKWIGDFKWLFYVREGRGVVHCLDSRVLNDTCRVRTIFYTRGNRLLFDPVCEYPDTGKGNAIGQLIPAGHAMPSLVPNSVVVRLIKCRDPNADIDLPVEEPDPSNKVAFSVKGKKFHFDKKMLCTLSFYFREMLSDNDDEKANQEVKLPDDEPDEFGAFLEAMLPVEQRVPVNPETVMGVTKLVHKYGVDSLLAECERSLKHAHEVPIVDRLLLVHQLQLEGDRVSHLTERNRILPAYQLQLKNVMDHLVGMLSAKDWKELAIDEREKVCKFSAEFLVDMTARFIA